MTFIQCKQSQTLHFPIMSYKSLQALTSLFHSCSFLVCNTVRLSPNTLQMTCLCLYESIDQYPCLARYLSLFRLAGLQAGLLFLFFVPCLLLFASLTFLTAPLYWINSGCHFPCWWNNSNTTYNNMGKVG